MKGEVIKYRYYKKSSNSLITVPKSIAKVLAWEENEKIHIEYRTFEKKRGLFIAKDGDGEIKYQAKQSTLTIPISVARALDWNDNDDIYISIKDIEGEVGLFLHK
jgi:bifunctional DNA-binding transcriptional regulator/antitoxin component of YhaV-PrlF toxin-antitoxin module